MPWHDHCFILNDAHDPVEVTQHEWIHWCVKYEIIKDTRISQHARVCTRWCGMVDDVTMPGPPMFKHIVNGPGLRDKTAETLTYDEALARHDRIVEWLRKRVERLEKKDD